MATRAKRPAAVRRANRRRVNQVQKLTNKKIQGFKDVVAILQKAVDSYRDSGAQWADGSIWADVSVRLGEGPRSIHYTLSPRLLRAIGVRRISVGSSARRVPQDNRPDQPIGDQYVSGGLPPNAGADLPKHSSHTAIIRKKGV